MQKKATTNKCDGAILFCVYQYKKNFLRFILEEFLKCIRQVKQATGSLLCSADGLYNYKTNVNTGNVEKYPLYLFVRLICFKMIKYFVCVSNGLMGLLEART